MPINDKDVLEVLDEATEEITTQRTRPIDISSEEFYGRTDSIYVRLQWYPEMDSFKFEVRNELINNLAATIEDRTKVQVPDGIASVSAFVRGMLEFALIYPHKMYQLGIRAQNNDVIRTAGNLSEQQKDLLFGEPQGNA